MDCSGVRLVAADTGPHRDLVLTGHVDLIPALFESVYVPSEVRDKLSREETPPEVRSWIAAPPAWLTIVPAPSKRDAGLLRLDRGERAAIVLAASVKVDAILMDDRAGVAAARGTGKRQPILDTLCHIKGRFLSRQNIF